jgi:hypothetical protein
MPLPPAADAMERVFSLIRVLLLLLPLVLVLVLVLVAGCASTQEAVANDLPVHCIGTPQAGKCEGRTRGFYYDYPSDTCRAFHYGPCHGPVAFTRRDQCEQTCVARGK